MPLRILVVALLFALLFGFLNPKKLPARLGRLGRFLGLAGRVGGELSGGEEAPGSPLAQIEVRAGELLREKVFREREISGDAAAQDRVNSVGARLAEVRRRRQIPYRFTLLVGDDWYAVAVPGGTIALTDGLVQACENDDEVAGLLAHEVAHIDSKHAVRSLAASSLFSSGTRFLPFARGFLAGRLIGTIQRVVTEGYRREQELEADQLGARLAHRAGFDGRALATFLERIASERGQKDDIGYLGSHPPLRERAQRLRSRRA